MLSARRLQGTLSGTASEWYEEFIGYRGSHCDAEGEIHARRALNGAALRPYIVAVLLL